MLFLFGKSGSGKSYIGDILGVTLEWHVYHADKDLTEEMTLALKASRPFTNDMRDRYFSVVAEKIQDLRKAHRRIVVTQGAYKNRHRHYLSSKIPDLEFIHIESSEDVIVERLSKREGGISISSAKALDNDFEPPGGGVNIITNNGSIPRVIEQLVEIAESMPNKFSQQDAAKLRLC